MSLPLPSEFSAPAEGVSARDYLTEYLGVIRRRWAVFLGVTLLVFAVGMVVLAMRPRAYQIATMLTAAPGSGYGDAPDSGDPVASMVASVMPVSYDAQISWLQSAEFTAAAMRAAGIPPQPARGVPQVTVMGDRSSGAIQITVEGSDPDKVARLANAVVALHRHRISETKSSVTRESLQLTRSETEKASRDLAAAEKKLLQFRQVHRGVGPSSERDSRQAELAALSIRVPELDSNLRVTEMQVHALRARLAQEPRELVQESSKENPRVQQLQERLDALSLQRMDLLQQYRPTSRPVRDLDQQMAQIRRLLAATPSQIPSRTVTPNPERPVLAAELEKLEASLQGLQQSDSAAAARLDAEKAMIRDLGPWELQYDRLAHDRDVAQAAYTSLAERLRALEVRARVWQGVAGLAGETDPVALPERPSRLPKPKHVAILGLMALLLGAGAVLLLEQWDDRVTVPAKLDQLLRLPVLGEIPLIVGGEPPLITMLPEDSPVVECYRALRANLGFAAMNGPLRTLVITSPHRGEGRSTIAVNLATVLAMAGRSVILVDADLRQPSLHRLLDLRPGPGLSELLLGQTSLLEALAESGVPGLKVLVSGAGAPNPADLVSMAPMAGLIEELRSMAEVVIIDTPPCLAVTDAHVLAAQVDGVLLVSDARSARKSDLKRALQLLDRAYARLVGLVLNRSGLRAAGGALLPASSPRPLPGMDGPKSLPASPGTAATESTTRLLPRGHGATYAALFLFTFVLWFRPYELIPALSSFTSMALISALLTLVLFLPSQFALEGRLTVRTPELKYLGIFCALALLSVPLAIDPGQAWETFADVFIKAALIFVIILNVVRTERRLLGLLLLALGAGLMLSVAGLNEFRQGHTFATGDRVSGIIGGIFGNPNDLALYLVMMMPIAVGLLLGAKRPGARLFYGLCAVTMATAVVVTYSRGGFLGLIAAAGALAILLWRRRRRAVMVVGLAGLVAFAVLAPGDYVSRVVSILNPALDPTGSSSAREDILTRSLQVVLHHPLFGVGMGNYHILDTHEQVNHNSYTQVASECGLPALCVYMLFIVAPLRQLRRIGRETASLPDRQPQHFLSIGLQASFVGFMVSSFFASVAYLWHIYYLVGYAVSLRRLHEGASAPVEPAAGRARRAAARAERRATRPLSA